MFTVLHLRLRRKVKASKFTKRVAWQEPWTDVITDFCSHLTSESDFKPEELKDKLVSLVQMELFFRTTSWVDSSDLAKIESYTTSLIQFAEEIEQIEQDLHAGGSPFANNYSCMV
jgi:antibiotic biosynthesis monooxygenase (ABM) superfamily enzyme